MTGWLMYTCLQLACILMYCDATDETPRPAEPEDFAKSEPSERTFNMVLESFDPPTHEWRVLNDPVMGGRSTGSFSVNDHGIGIFSGQVRNVPFLHVPGFIQARSIANEPYPDISSCTAFELSVRTTQPDYTGYRCSFGTRHAPNGKRFAYGYKVHFTIPSSENGEFHSIRLPFNAFTDAWDDATGDPIHECNITDVQDSIYCPDEAALRNIQTISVWGEGVLGDVSIEISLISAVDCSTNNGTSRHRGNDSKRDSRPTAATSQYTPPSLRSSTAETEGSNRFFAYLDWTRHWSWLRHHVVRVWSQQLSIAFMIVPFLR
jgi:Complex I intermediate-associated protein 30 (CIA30)